MCVFRGWYLQHIETKSYPEYIHLYLYITKKELRVDKKSTKNRIEKWTKDMNRHFTEEETRMEKMFNPLVSDANKDHDEAFSTF